MLLMILAKRRKWWGLVMLGLAVGLVFVLRQQSLSKKMTLVLLNGETMGTTYFVKVVAELDKSAKESLQTQINGLLSTVNAQMSTYIPESEISRFNASETTTWFPVSKDFVFVAELARKISRDSLGAFDPTVQPLVNAWGFGPEGVPSHQPEDLEIERMKTVVGMHHLQIQTDPPAIRKLHGKVSLDFSAIAKGFAVDKIAEHLEYAGFKNYLVEIGGEIRALGQNTEGYPWKLGIEKPQLTEESLMRSVQKTINLNFGAMATSGSYRNYREIDGRRFSHTIDPRTGYPISHRLVSVTVVHNSCAEADGWATALNVLGPKEGLKIADLYGLAAYLVVMTEEGTMESVSERFSTLDSEPGAAIP